ncbi:M50 family metallopeptidase [Thalassotalea crassostreae]|uniref:M50 family metallopeptidase n=1 Tax=Thalassotalea crassostreae TaxID=1763536 RepID=UPI000837B33F|nr:M50 family metallopeptidase [Thalassotalea crassostreae]
MINKSDAHSKLSRLGNNFWLLLVVALVLQYIPFLSIPFNWLESYFHEISHGLAALLTGGSIVQIELFTNGAGLCTTLGGSTFVIAFSGYAGAVMWGVLMYKIAQLNNRVTHIASALLALLIVVSCLLWVRDLLTLFICLCLLALFLFSLKISHFPILPVVLKLFAIMVLLNSLKSPLYLIDNQNIGDGAMLASLTFIPEMVWIVIWSAIGASGIYYLRKS